MPYQIRCAARRAALAIALMAVITPLHAHGPTRQKVVEKIAIDAPPAAVWAAIKDFDALAKWHPAVAESPASAGNGEGSVRTLKLKGGGGLVETLERYNDTGMSYSYRAKDGGALPVTNYTSTITVSAGEAGKSVVEWRGAFYRGFPNNDPPPDQNDEAAVKAVTGVYQAGLANLKQLVEKR
ncbi:SRPBCC family protein [Caldimonas sp. KR1-144]|uniref:SRPBCC family protein n=1 Tax=Caldimonas sp. KR1-144 TaxID=3400911 RepID=UPI003C05B431